jgi:hypothetical protein
MPVNDLIGHEFVNCICGPTDNLIDTSRGDGWIIVHHSLDGRERFE